MIDVRADVEAAWPYRQSISSTRVKHIVMSSLSPSSCPPPPFLPLFVSVCTLKKNVHFPALAPAATTPSVCFNWSWYFTHASLGAGICWQPADSSQTTPSWCLSTQKQTVFSHSALARPLSRCNASLTFNLHSCLQSWAGAVTFDLPHHLLSSARQTSLLLTGSAHIWLVEHKILHIILLCCPFKYALFHRDQYLDHIWFGLFSHRFQMDCTHK